MSNFARRGSSVANTTRLPSPNLWGNCNEAGIRDGVVDGVVFWDDFINLAGTTINYVKTAKTTGTFIPVSGGVLGGAAVADPGATTDHQGVNVQQGGVAGSEWLLPNNGTPFWFEARLKMSAIVNGADFFMGLSPDQTSILTSGAMNTTDFLGFKSVTNDGVILACTQNTTEATKACVTLVANTYIKLGMHFPGSGGYIYQYVNGLELSGYRLADTYIPNVLCKPSLVCEAGGTAQTTVTIDWWKFAQQF